jgi:hypothetical protein
LLKVIENPAAGVMENWSVGKKDIYIFVITPTLQYANTSKLIEIEDCHDGLPSFGSRPD